MLLTATHIFVLDYVVEEKLVLCHIGKWCLQIPCSSEFALSIIKIYRERGQGFKNRTTFLLKTLWNFSLEMFPLYTSMTKTVYDLELQEQTLFSHN